MWVYLLLENMEFLPESAKTLLRILALGGAITVEKGDIWLPAIGPHRDYVHTDHNRKRKRDRIKGRGSLSVRHNEDGHADTHSNSSSTPDHNSIIVTPFRGNLDVFIQNLQTEYSNAAITSVAILLGKTVRLARTPF